MPNSRFPFRATLQNIAICHVALETYKVVDRKHPETVNSLIKTFTKTRTTLMGSGDPTLCLLRYPETMLVASAIEFLIEQDEKTPEVCILRPEDRREAETLVAALGDYNATQAHLWRERRSQWENSTPIIPTAAEVEERRIKAKRDEIFREIVGTPEHVDIWGNVVVDEPVDPKVRRQEAKVENLKQAYGGKDLRKHAKSPNFMGHPLQMSRVKLDADPNEVVAMVKKINKKLTGLLEDLVPD